MSDYPCPACGTPADLSRGCPGCHRPPDPDAARVVELDRTITGLAERVERARVAYREAVDRLNATVAERNVLAARVAAQARRVPPGPPLETEVRPARPESSGRTVQNLLFVLGGLLLGSAAIVFTAVAWASFGIAGRAVILAAVTVLTLAVPPVVRLRRLTGTAETFAALGLLLVLLDGYAAWAVNLGHVTGVVSPTRYAGLVCAGTAVVALGYGRLTRLTGPGFVALALAQPVPPLLLAGTGLGPAGWSATFTSLALADLAVVWWARRPKALPVLAWALAGFAACVAAGVAAVAGSTAGDVPGALRAGVAELLVALLLVPAALLAPRLFWLRQVAGGVVAFVLFLAAARVLGLAWPELRLAPPAGAVLVLAVLARLVPASVRPGPRIGVLAAAGLVAVAPVALALVAAGSTVGAALTGSRAGSAEPWIPVALGLVTLAVMVLLPRWPAVPVVGGALLAFLVPVSATLPWWAPSIVDGLVAVPLALLAARTHRAGTTTLHGAVAGVLAAHAVGIGLGSAPVEAAVLAALLGLAALTAGLARQTGVGSVATCVAFLVPAGLGATLASAAGWPVTPFAVAGLVLSTVAVLALRRPLGGYLTGAALAVPLAGLGVVVASRFDGWYLAVPLLCDALVGSVLRRRAYLVLSAPAAVPPLVQVLPTVWALLLAPYAWLSAIWSGVPAGTGLVPPGAEGLLPHGAVFGFGPAAVSLALLAVALGWRRRPGALGQAAGPASLAVLAGAVALGAPWPTVPALSLAIGAAAALLAALRPVPVMAALAVPVTGAGLAATLPTNGSTLAGLAAVLVTATVCGVAGKRLAGRVCGWLVAVAAGVLLAVTAAEALDITPYRVPFWVLTVAAVALALSGVLRGGTERLAVESAAHASAAVALLLTGTLAEAAVVLGLWGVAVGLRAVWPGERVPARRRRIVGGVACELVAYWLVLAGGGVSLVEAYTVPAAVVGLFAGWLAARTRPALHSWSAYGPGLLAGFGPSLALVLTVPGEPVRRLVLGLAGVLVVVAGAVRRRQAPVVVGGTALALIALHESVLLWDLLPRWIPLGAAGLLLVGLAVSYERRRRDLRRLRVAVSGMR